FKDAERDLRELSNDIHVFYEALKGFDRVLRSRQTRHNVSGKVIASALGEAITTIQDLETRLTQFSSSDVSPVRRMKWVQHKSSVKKLHNRLKEQSAMLQSFLALAHAETFLAVCSQYPDFLQINSQDDAEYDSTSIQGSMPSRPSTAASGSSLSSIRRLSIDTAASSIASSTSSQQGKIIDTSPTSPIVQSFVDSVQGHDSTDPTTSARRPSTETLTIRRACWYDCFCQCHAQSTPIPIRGLSRMKPSQHQCTEPTCKGVQSSGEKVAVTSNIFRKAISQVMSSKSIKVRYDLNTYRMVSEGSDAMRSVKHGNLERLKSCFESGEATLWDTAPDGWSLLHVSKSRLNSFSRQTNVYQTAAYNRQLPIVRYLVGLGASTEVADVGTRKPADLAILKSLGADSTHVEQDIVEVFSRKDDYLSDFEFTPIHIATLELYDPTDAERPSLEQLIELLDNANNAPAGNDWAQWKSRYRTRSPLYGDIIELFRASAAESPKTQKIIHNLLDRKDVKYCWTPLHWASSAGRTDKMKILVDHGADPFILSNLDANIIHAAAESVAVDGLVVALDIWKRHPQRLNINQSNRWGETPLHVAAWGSVECVRHLLAAGADRDVRQEDQQVPLHCAGLSTRGEIRQEIVRLLCAGGSASQVNAQDADGRPPLFDFLDDPLCIELLMDAGVRLDSLDTSGKSVFHHASIQNENSSLELLLQRSPPNSVMVTVKDHDGNSALIHALQNGSTESAMTLLKLDSVGDAIGQGGWTAVHHAAKLGNPDVLEAILKHPSFVKGMKTIDGKSVETVAMEAGNWCGKVKELLRKYNTVT
ncbi:MAG: hypothetical protein Q9211_001978, partial [Gyalolechia sp. 1 TL-2023]